ncbi:glucose-6-phosphate dehydrogenase [Gilvimarinus sp. F26214L]|uniref:glucose-6-phosphate dehydrogenase n=1 Tax=Gilvimarinus sp. DZF01 TaxID=3461371 RepID=UPI004045D8E9
MKCDILIVGGEGDLAYRKLYPALYYLDVSGCLSDCLKVVGIARNKAPAEDFAERVRAKLEEFHGTEPLDEDTWQRFAARLRYYPADATAREDLEALRNDVFAESDRDLIVYLATPPSIFAPICEALAAVGLVRDNSRLVVEKPLGDSRESFLEINRSLTSIFREDQVYRIDHYLGKETVQNLLAMRFANALFEPLWNSHYIDHVQITVAETVGVEGRWDFYDDAGALRDMVQNHLLQLLCLAAMEPPARIDPEAVRDEKLKVLRSLKPLGKRGVRDNTVRGQYVAGAVGGRPVPGYMEEEGARPGSNTETFVAVKAEIDNWRWAGVPFYLRTGKRMVERFSEIIIQFNEVPHSIFGEQMTSGAANRLTIRLQPDEGIQLHLLNKVPGLDETMPLESVALNLSLSDVFTNRRVPDAYERLFYDVMRRNSTLFMRADEVEAAWAWVDKIVEGWRATKKRVVSYTAGSWGPAESIALIAKDGRQWHE